MAETTENIPTFRGGLVLAGAVSGGAYMAGVLDYILQALEAWEAAKKSNLHDIPNHKFEIRAISGASAGSICAAVCARALASNVVPVRDVNNPPDRPADNPKDEIKPFLNPFYATWVQSIDIKHLLKADDLKTKKAELMSLLDSTALPYIGSNVLNIGEQIKKERPAYVADKLDLFLNSTNLRGVPYGLGFKGQVENYRHMMDVHAEYKHFQLSWDENTFPGNKPTWLDPRHVSADGHWLDFVSSSIASGAFPVGLSPRFLSRNVKDYDVSPRYDNYGSPHWPGDIKAMGNGYTYQYMNVDGGVMNNEPLELARQTLSGGKKIKNPRDGEGQDPAKAAVIMIDPFPNTSDVNINYEPEKNIFEVVLRLVSIVTSQMRFKPEELKLSLDDEVYSRFVIAPVYANNQLKIEPLAIYGELLGSFGAFLSESFRRHDFQLGRRNAQQFLKNYFVLPENNPLFKDWSEAMKMKYTVPHRKGPHLPIIPVIQEMGEAVFDEIAVPDRPRAAEIDLDDLKLQLRFRVKAVVPRLIAAIPNGILRTIAKLVWKLDWLIGISKIISNGLIKKIDDELKKLNEAVLK